MTPNEMLLIICQLRRERDEAREDLAHIKEYGTDEINAAVGLRQQLASALVERDEARELLEAAQNALDAIHLEVGSWIKKLKKSK